MSVAPTTDILDYINPVSAVGSVICNVAAGATQINPGEPVVRAQGAVSVTAMATNKPVVKTDFVVGIAETTSTQTASAAGTVQVKPLLPGQIYLITPNVAATWNTQAKYDALVGKRVLIDLTANLYTILANDSSTSGCIIMAMNINDNPGKVAFALDSNLSDLSFQD